DEEDVDIDEFSDAIPAEILTRLKNIGCDTAKAVLELSGDELARRTELPKETTQKIILLMEAEFAPEGEEIELPSGETLTVGGEDEGETPSEATTAGATTAGATTAEVPAAE